MAPTPKAPSPLVELAPWVLLLIITLSASRMAPDGMLPQDLVLAAYALVALSCGFLTILGRLLAKVPCPKCRRGLLRQLAHHPRFFRCPACGMRLRRSWTGTLRDAMGPEYAHRFGPTAGNWLDAPIADADETTCGTLLGRKRLHERFLLAFARDRRKPWPGPRIDPAQPEAAPVAGETTQGALLRKKKARALRFRP